MNIIESSYFASRLELAKVYEEELQLRKGFEWSPDSQQIAYWQIDQSDVRVVQLVNNTVGKYPVVTRIPYPKTGETNPSAKVGLVSAKGANPKP